MKILSKDGLLWHRNEKLKDIMLDVTEADAIALSNGFYCAEQVVKLFKNEIVEVDDITLKIKEMGGKNFTAYMDELMGHKKGQPA